jgi:hypothetical protein
MSEIEAKKLFSSPTDRLQHVLYEMTTCVGGLFKDGELERLDALNADFNTLLTEYKEAKSDE